MHISLVYLEQPQEFLFQILLPATSGYMVDKDRVISMTYRFPPRSLALSTGTEKLLSDPVSGMGSFWFGSPNGKHLNSVVPTE